VPIFNLITASVKGCNVLTCRNHSPKCLYFCAHCKIECTGNYSTCSCPDRNDMKSRERVLALKNDSNRCNPSFCRRALQNRVQQEDCLYRSSETRKDHQSSYYFPTKRITCTSEKKCTATKKSSILQEAN
jgi:hypothetical protein